MAKWLGGIITALVLLTLTSTLGALLKEPIDELASSDRLQAQVQLSPWYPKPDENMISDGKAAPQTEGAFGEINRKRMETYTASNVSSTDFQLARMVITNESSQEVKDINFRFRSPYSADEALLIDSSGNLKRFKNADRIYVPNLRPGDKAIIYMWSNFWSSYTFPDALRTYSSSGKFRLSYDWPQSQGDEYGSWIGMFLDDYAGTVAVVAGICLAIVLFVVALVSEGYYRSLLKDAQFYADEKDKFDHNPRKFKPDLSKLA